MEKLIFQHAWLVVLVAGLLNQAVLRLFDPLFCLVTLLLAVSAALFGLWMRSIPILLQHLYDRCAKKEHRQLTSILNEAYDQITSRRRFIPISIGIAVAIAFIGFHNKEAIIAKASTPVLAWVLSLIPWAWMIGSAGTVAFGIAKLVRTVGETGILQILPEHPDGCGGLKPVGMFFTRMLSPVLLISVLLGFTSLDPELPKAQTRVFETRPLMFLIQPPQESKTLIRDRQVSAVVLQMRSEVGAVRVAHLKKECSELKEDPNSPLYADCIIRVFNESDAIAEAHKAGHGRLWNSRIIPFARVGLLILIACIGPCFIWPLGSVHSAMKRERDTKGLELAGLLDQTEKHFHEKLKAHALQEAAAMSEHLEKVRKQILRIRRYPVWPFDAAAVSKVIIPQLLALGSTMGGLIMDWLAR